MTRRDIGKLCIFPTQKTLRENAQPYRFWGLLGFPPRSEGLNNKIKVIKRRCYGIYNLGRLFQHIWLDVQGRQVLFAEH